MENNNNETNQTVYIQNNPENVNKKDRKAFSIAALVLGIISIVLSCLWYVSVPAGILAIILGIIGLKSTKRNFSIAGIVTGVIGILLTILLIFAIIFLGIIALTNIGIDTGSNFYNNIENFEDNLKQNIEDYSNNFEDRLDETIKEYQNNFEINYDKYLDRI